MPLGQDDGGPRRGGRPEDRAEVSRVGHLVEEEDEAASRLAAEGLLDRVVLPRRHPGRDAVVGLPRRPVELLSGNDTHGDSLLPRRSLQFPDTTVAPAFLQEERLDRFRTFGERGGHRMKTGDDHGTSTRTTAEAKTPSPRPKPVMPLPLDAFTETRSRGIPRSAAIVPRMASR